MFNTLNKSGIPCAHILYVTFLNADPCCRGCWASCEARASGESCHTDGIQYSEGNQPLSAEKHEIFAQGKSI